MFNYFKDFCVYYIISVLFINIIPGDENKRYLKMLLSILFILIMVTPLLNILNKAYVDNAFFYIEDIMRAGD